MMPTKRLMAIALRAASFLAVFSTSAKAVNDADNLLVNGNFASDLSSWEATSPIAVTWRPVDVASNPNSGSAFALIPAGPPSQRLVLQQCVPISSAGTYVLMADGFIPAGQGRGDLLMWYEGYFSRDCGFGEGLGGSGGALVGSVNAWSRAIRVIPIPPGTAGSILIRLYVDKSTRGIFAGYFDNVVLLQDTEVKGSVGE
jgi:hypothetical protein